MSQPNQILQCLHSSWIDALNICFPDDKLELGMPKKLNGWGTLESSTQFWSCEVHTAEVRGFCSWGLGSGQNSQEIQKLTAQSIKSATQHAKVHHGIDLVFGKVQESQPFVPGCTIWFPITVLAQGQRMVFDLGVSF